MANYRKSFNFRNGVQVDNDKFLVDGRGNVGVGTSAPSRPLDVYGTARVNGLLDTTTLKVSSASTFSSLVSIGNSVFLNPTTGIISAVSYRGDGTLLAGVIAIATDGWVKNAGTLSTSFNIYQGPFTAGVLPVAAGPLQIGVGNTAFIVDFGGSVGVGTTIPRSTLDVRGGIGATTLRVTGVSTFTDNIFLDSDDALILGGGSQFGSLKYNSSLVRNQFDGTNSDFYIRAKNYTFATGASGFPEEKSITIAQDGSVALYFNDSKKIETSGVGVTITGITSTTNLYVTGIGTFGGAGGAGYVDVQDNLSNRTYVAPGSIQFNNIGANSIQQIGTQLYFRAGGSGASSYYFSNYFGGSDNELFFIDTVGNIRVANNARITGVTTTSSLNVSGIATIQTSLILGNNISLNSSSGVITATTLVGTLVGFATTARNLTDGANILAGTINDARLPDLITSNILATTGISTVIKLRSDTIGVGTDSFTSDLAVVKDASVSFELISKTGSASIGIGSEALGGNRTARIRYNPSTQVLDFDNNGSGEVNFHVHKGNGSVVGTQTGGFFFKTGSASKVLLNLAYDGRVSINESVPLLTDLDYSLMVNGNTKIRGLLDLDQGINAGSGIVTVSSLRSTNPSTFPNNQNFNTTSGISTFNNFNILSGSKLTVSGIASFVGVTTFLSNITIGSSTVATNSPVDIFAPITLKQTSVGFSTAKIYYDYTGGISTGFSDPRDQVKLNSLIAIPSKKISAFGYGDYQVRTGGLSIICADYINIHPSVAVTTTGSWEGLTPSENSDMGLKYSNGANLPMIGINTIFARSLVDVGYAVTSMNSYFIPPRLTTTELYYVSQLWNPAVAGAAAGNWFNHTRANVSTPSGVISGGIVFDTTASQLKVGIGSTTFCGVATYTNNHSGFSAFVPPTLTTTDRNTLTNSGIQSGAIIYNSTSNRLEVRLNNAWFGISTVV